eukprot:432230-Rhodomonas_salina.3
MHAMVPTEAPYIKVPPPHAFTMQREALTWEMPLPGSGELRPPSELDRAVNRKISVKGPSFKSEPIRYSLVSSFVQLKTSSRCHEPRFRVPLLLFEASLILVGGSGRCASG